jgi:hypothetical protein
MLNSARHYSRKDVMLSTGISAAEFEHISRVGILRPAEGTSGNRAHRRYDELEFAFINIAALIWRQGVGPSQLVGLAGPFQAAMDWFRAHGLIGNEEVAEILISVAGRVTRRGQIALSDLRNFTSWSGVQPLSHSLRGIRPPGTKLTYDEVAELLRELHYDVPDQLVQECRDLSKTEWDLHVPRYCTVSDQSWSLGFVRTLYLYQEDGAHWRDTYETAPVDVEFFLTVNLVMLKKRVFGVKPPRTGAL